MAAIPLGSAELCMAGNTRLPEGFGEASNREPGCPLPCVAFCVHRLEALIQGASKGDSVCSLQEHRGHVTAEPCWSLECVQCRRPPFLCRSSLALHQVL